MPSKLNPYLHFRDNAREAMDFYASVFGGTVTANTFSEFGMSDDPAEADKIMHSELDTPAGYVIMGADTPNSMTYEPGSRSSVSISGNDTDALRGYWDGLADGATITVPMSNPPWGGLFGMLTDRYGVDWMVSIDDTVEP